MGGYMNANLYPSNRPLTKAEYGQLSKEFGSSGRISIVTARASSSSRNSHDEVSLFDKNFSFRNPFRKRLNKKKDNYSKSSNLININQATNSADAITDGTKEIIHKLKEDLMDLYKEDACQPIMVRLAWHDSGTYDKETKTGGANGSIRFKDESGHGANAGLKWAME